MRDGSLKHESEVDEVSICVMANYIEQTKNVKLSENLISMPINPSFSGSKFSIFSPKMYSLGQYYHCGYGWFSHTNFFHDRNFFCETKITTKNFRFFNFSIDLKYVYC